MCKLLEKERRQFKVSDGAFLLTAEGCNNARGRLVKASRAAVVNHPAPWGHTDPAVVPVLGVLVEHANVCLNET